MHKLALTCLATGILSFSGTAQTLFSYGGTPVSKEEFLRVYQKNTLNKQPDYSEAALKEYLDLYSLFRMKVAEAEKQHLDTVASIQSELNNYRKQLAKNYLTDEEITNKMVREAYDRMKEEVNVAHILIMNPLTADTVAAYRKADSIYNVLQKGGDFAALAKQFSEDRGSKDNGGAIGYMTALQTVYPFENAVYSTPAGKISRPFRTQFGYHIVKVMDKRPSRGEVKVAQIMIGTPKSKGDQGEKDALAKMQTIKAELKKGVPFEELAKKYSEDKFSVNEGGVLPQFGAGKMVPAFENAAFELKKPGDVSEPVKTDYGYHLIKLIAKYPMKPFDSLQPTLKRKVDNDSRAQTAKDFYFEKVKAKNGYSENKANLEELFTKVATSIPDTGKAANTFKASDYRSMNKTIFTLSGKNYTQSDFMNYAEGFAHGRLNGPKKPLLADIYKNYVNTVVNDLEEHNLVENNKDFKLLMEEYRSGIMLFELMDRNVWTKASKDTTGLKAFYEANKSKYMWDPGFTGAVYKFKDEATMAEGRKLLADPSVKEEDVVKKLNVQGANDAVSVQRGHFEFKNFKDVPQGNIIAGKTTDGTKTSDGKYTVVKVDKVYNAPVAKTLEEARGYVVAEYQDHLEKQWNDQMRKKYPMKLNDVTFKSMVKK